MSGKSRQSRQRRQRNHKNRQRNQENYQRNHKNHQRNRRNSQSTAPVFTRAILPRREESDAGKIQQWLGKDAPSIPPGLAFGGPYNPTTLATWI